MSGQNRAFTMAWFDACIDKMFCGRDADKLLPYPSVRYVSIQDRRLGLLYYIFILTIILYIFIYVLLIQKAYLLRTIPVGTVRTSLQAPSFQYLKDPSELIYCGNGTYVSGGIRFPQHECRYLAADFLVFPSLEQSALLVTSRIVDQLSIAMPGCNPPLSPTCLSQPTPLSGAFYYAAQVELYTLLLDHAFSASGVTRNAQQMSGSIDNINGGTLDLCGDYAPGQCPSFVSIGQNTQDIVPVNVLLRAAGVNLEEQSDHDASAICPPNSFDPNSPNYCVGESSRSAGVTLLLTILYDNTFSYDLNSYRYTYHVERIRETGTEFKTLQYVASFDGNAGNNTIYDRHGVRVIVAHGGTIGSFDFQTLLISLVSSTGLLAVATFLVDFIMQWCMPDRKVYRQYKYLTTVDFSDFRDGLVAVDAAQQEMKAAPLVPGDRVDHTSGELIHPDDPPEKQQSVQSTKMVASGLSPRRVSFTEQQILQQLSPGGGKRSPAHINGDDHDRALMVTVGGGSRSRGESVELTAVGGINPPPAAEDEREAARSSNNNNTTFHVGTVPPGNGNYVVTGPPRPTSRQSSSAALTSNHPNYYGAAMGGSGVARSQTSFTPGSPPPLIPPPPQDHHRAHSDESQHLHV